MKKLFLASLLCAYSSCSSSHLKWDRIPASDPAVENQECLQTFKAAKQQAIEILQKNPNLLGAEKSRQMLLAKDGFELACAPKVEGKAGFQTDRSGKKIYFEHSLRSTEYFFETDLAKKQVDQFDIELRAITYDQLTLATMLQAMDDISHGTDSMMNTYFQFLRASQK